MGVFCRRRSYASRENHGGGQLYPSPHIFVEALRPETENDASNRLFSGRRRARGAKWRRPRRSGMEATPQERSGGHPMERNGGAPVERRRHDGGAAAKGSDLTVQNKTDRQAQNRRGTRRGDGVEHGTATRWSEVEGAWERRSGSRRCGPASRCHTSKAAALHARQDGKSASNPTGSLQGIPSGCLQPQLRRSTVRRPPCRGESRPVNARGPLDVAGLSSPGPLTGQSFHACARPSGDGASPTPRPAWP